MNFVVYWPPEELLCDDEELESDDELADELAADDDDELAAAADDAASAGALNCWAILAETLEFAARIAFELFKLLTLIMSDDPGDEELFEAGELDEKMKPPFGKNGLIKFQKIASAPFDCNSLETAFLKVFLCTEFLPGRPVRQR